MEDACRVGEMLWKTAEKLRRHGGKAEKGRSAREAVMEVVIAHPDGIMVKDIAKAISRSPGSVSQTIEMLVRDGMVSRTVSQRDRRAVTIHPTARGRAARADYFLSLNGMVSEALASVTAEEREVFEKVLAVVESQFPASPHPAVR